MVMLTIAAGNTALQSVLPALGRSLGVADSAVAAAFSISALLWVVAAPFWANRSDRRGRRAMVLLGLCGFTLSLFVCAVFLMAGINGWIAPTAAFVAFVGGRMIYGSLGAAAPPAVQAMVAGQTTREERTKALALLGSAFGLGTILGPAIGPYLVLGSIGAVEVGLSGPAYLFGLFGLAMTIVVWRMLPDDRSTDDNGADELTEGHGAAQSYPSIGGQSSGAAITAATQPNIEQIGFFDARIRAWMIIGLVMGHAQAMTGQAIGFLIIDRLAVPPIEALGPTGIVLMIGAGASLLVQWGFIPLLNLKPAALIFAGCVFAALGCVAVGNAASLYGIAMGFGLASMGFGFLRPGFTAGASLAVGPAAQGSVAGKVTSVNGAAFVLGPSIGVGLYELWRPLPYLVAAAALVLLLGYAWATLRQR
ncbi:MFS transporter [Sphingomonas sp. 37zxx]|uniref:MFS transporter n=1 Tax=Sphingomonas sp. 37zxx TaxID=1550073 RepID=UPI000691D1A8